MLALKIILIVLAIIALLILLAFVAAFIAGRFLPKKYRGRVEAIIDRPIEDVWLAIVDFENNPISAGSCKKVILESDDNGQTEILEDLGPTKMKIVVESEDKPKSIVRVCRDTVVPMESRCTIELDSLGDTCKVSATNEIVVNDGTWHVPIFRTMLFATGAAKSGMKRYLAHVAKNLETKPEFNH